MMKKLRQLLSRFAPALRRTMANPSPSMAAIIGMVTLVPSAVLLTDLTSISADGHFWAAEGVLAGDPLRLALASYWLMLWAVCAQMAIVSAKSFGKFRF